MNYIPRLIENQIKEKLDFYGAISVEGCKWCGKSTTAKQFARSILELQNPDSYKNSLELIELDASRLLAGDKPKLIDEWQNIPSIWDAVRYDIDKTSLSNQYILTGSASPLRERPMHSGTGRIVRLKMRPMSLFESGDSTAEISVNELFSAPRKILGHDPKTLQDIIDLAIRGGWPEAVVKTPKNPNMIAIDYIDSIINDQENYTIANNYSSYKMRDVIRSMARNICTPINNSTIAKDSKVSNETVASYTALLESLHILDDIPAWSPKLRSKTEIRSGSKRNFVDPSLAITALHATRENLLDDLNTLGFVFESLCLRDLNIYMDNLGGEVFYYRDKNGLECDAILHLDNGQWGAAEIKLGATESIESAAASLKKLASNIDQDDMATPAFLVVITAIGYAYRRPDGVYVVPIGCLKP